MLISNMRNENLIQQRYTTLYLFYWGKIRKLDNKSVGLVLKMQELVGKAG